MGPEAPGKPKQKQKQTQSDGLDTLSLRWGWRRGREKREQITTASGRALVRLVKAMDFPLVMYGCESWTIKKAEHRIIDAFELWCWRRLLRVPWTARRSNQSILKEISPE